MRGFKINQRVRQEYIELGAWEFIFYRFTRSKHGPRIRRCKDDARWWNRIERRSKREN